LRKKKGNSFARVGILSIVMGIGYAGWTDTTSVGGTMQTGYTEVGLSEGVGSENVTASILGHTLDIEIDAGGEGEYYYDDFDIHNLGTIPVKIQDIAIVCSPGLVTEVTRVGVGTQIEQSGVDPDTVYGTVTMTAPGAGTYSCEVTFHFIQWNLYEE
jgi:hypothetical protein